jgi:hypothetical protein
MSRPKVPGSGRRATPMTRERWESLFGIWYVPEPNTGCWLWTRGQCRGYGVLKANGSQRTAYRLSYELLRGPVPAGFELDHLCRTPACVNPDHLEPVTHAENMRRGKIARKTHCKRGHPLSGENLKQYPGKTPKKRCCVICHRMHRAEWWSEQTAERRAELLARSSERRRARAKALGYWPQPRTRG